MRERATIRMLPDGRRLHLNDGPIDLIVGVDGTGDAIKHAYEAAAQRFATILDELCEELPLLRRAVGADSLRPGGSIAQRMFDAVAPYGARCFITPMAAVAGAVAEAVLAAMVKAEELDRAYVNNGGDIAFHLAGGQSYRVGMVERPEEPSLLGLVEIAAEMPIRGIATSGWRGRSFSLGIADAVTVLAESAAQADAAATVIANAVDLPEHPAIARIAACEIAPDSDLGGLLVTRGVGALSSREIESALENGKRVAEELREMKWIQAAALLLSNEVRVICGDEARLQLTARCLEHA